MEHQEKNTVKHTEVEKGCCTLNYGAHAVCASDGSLA